MLTFFQNELASHTIKRLIVSVDVGSTYYLLILVPIYAQYNCVAVAMR